MKMIRLIPHAIRTPLQHFLSGESVSGLLLILSAAAAFVIANTAWSERYFELQHVYIGLTAGDWSLKLSLLHWINDGLMAIFFLLVGLEIKREMVVGELSRPRDAALSIFAALGGMIVPAFIFALINWNTEALAGWGIPMATDIAFAIGVLSLLGQRIPLGLKVFLTALAIVDDLGAVLVIALFYTANLQLQPLVISLVLLIASALYGWMRGHRLFVYIMLGVVSWYFMLKSGVHATVAGVLLAFTVPMTRRIEPTQAQDEIRAIVTEDSFEEAEVKMENLDNILSRMASPLHRLEHDLVPWVSYLIIPIFAFFNAGVSLQGSGVSISGITLGAFVGLLLGKPVGIFLFCWLTARFGWSSLPRGVTWSQLAWAGVLAGIGFTMSFFISSLAYADAAMLDQAKIGVLSASIIAAVLGLIGLYWVSDEGTVKKSEEL